MGYSLGAFQSLFLAAQAATNQAPLIRFERFVGSIRRLICGIA